METLLLGLRAALGGMLMGLANLVPGISGGTMLLAAGVYPAFIEGIAEVTRLRFRARSLFLLGWIAVAAAGAILFFAGAVKTLVVDHRWVMYSLFIGLTLGGVPIVWSMVGRRRGVAVWVGALAGFMGMAALALAQQRGADGGGAGSNLLLLFLAGAAGAGAMILPGVSGGYLLLVLGQYVPILSAIDTLKEALRAGNLAAAWAVGVEVLLPVGVGVILGIVGVSNLFRLLLHRYRQATLGVLLGLLVGAVVGIWPFQASVPPRVGDMLKGRVVTAERLVTIAPEDCPTAFFRPDGPQVAGALGLIAGGFLLTFVIARLGGREEEGDGDAHANVRGG